MSRLNVSVIILDFGGVLGKFDHWFIARALAHFSRYSAEEIYARVFDGGLEEAYDCGRVSTPQFLASVRATLGLDLCPGSLAGIWSGLFSRSPANERVIRVLNRIPGNVRLFLASNTNELHARVIRSDWSDILERMAGTVLSYEVGCRKPAAEYFVHLATVINARPDEALFVDDRKQNCAAAAVAGIRTCHFGQAVDFEAVLSEFGIRLSE